MNGLEVTNVDLTTYGGVNNVNPRNRYEKWKRDAGESWS